MAQSVTLLDFSKGNIFNYVHRMRSIGIIPARYASTRLEGKPLLSIAGKPMIQHVYERAVGVLPEVYVATDDERIHQVVSGFGGRSVMTSTKHLNGTTRCREAVDTIQRETKKTYDCIINVQGDEPLLAGEQLKSLMDCFKNDRTTEMATLVAKVTSLAELSDPSECFVVIDQQGYALYFSRTAIPFVRGVDRSEWLSQCTFYKHIGLYAYTYPALCAFTEMPPSSLEQAEMLEQNRWLEAGRRIKVATTTHQTYPVDTMDDLLRVRAILER